MFDDIEKKLNRENSKIPDEKDNRKKEHYSVDKEIKAKNDLAAQAVKTAVPHHPALKEFDGRIKKLREKGKKRGKRYSIIGISASIIISAAVFAGGYFLFNQIINITDEVELNKETNSFSNIIDPEGQCGNDNCCLASLEKIRKHKYLKYDKENGCAAGYEENKLNCETSLSWCEAVKEEICAKAGEEISIMPTPNGELGKKCCAGLTESASYTEINNECAPELDVAICLNCLDGTCGPGENKCNCPEDCFEASTSLELLLDSDNDGLLDIEEADYGADVNNPDTDGDGYSDGDEVKNGFNPAGEGVLGGDIKK